MIFLGVHKGKGYGNKIPSARPRGGALLPGAAHVSVCPAPAPHLIQIQQGPPTLARALLTSTFATFQSSETDWKAERGWRSQAAATHQNCPQSADGGGKQARYRPLHSGICDWLVPASLILLRVWRSRSGAWPRGGRAARSRRGRESQVRRTRGPSARSPHAGKVLAAATGGAEAEVVLLQPRRVPDPASATVSCPRGPCVPGALRSRQVLGSPCGSRDGPTQECQRRRREQQ